MKKRFLRAFFLLSFLAAAAACAGTEKREDEGIGRPGRSPKPSPAAPVVSQSFASPRISPGTVWKVYLKAADADGDMGEFVCVIHQPGVGTYPVSLTRIREENRRDLSGYLFLNITAFKSLDFAELTLTVQIRDRAGAYSDPVEFPLSINPRHVQEPPPAGVFQEADLGPILIDLRAVGDDRPGFFDRLRR